MVSSRVLEELQNPEKVQNILKNDRPDDCLSCKILGATAFIGLGGYSYFSGHSQLKAQHAKILKSKSMFGLKSRQAGVTTIAFSLVGMGLWRLMN